MSWGWSNLILGAIGAAVVAGSVLLFRNREAAFARILRQQKAMFGSWAASKIQRRATPMSGVGAPAIFGIVFGAVFVLVAIFGHPHIA